MIRRLFTLASLLSLVLCLATVVLWVRSYRREDLVLLRSRRWWPNGSAAMRTATRQHTLACSQGVLVLQSTGIDRQYHLAETRERPMIENNPPYRSWKYESRDPDDLATRFENDASLNWHGFYFRSHVEPVQFAPRDGVERFCTGINRVIAAPICSFVMLTGVVPACWLAARIRAPRGRYSGPQCGRCGYNLTANTSGICPECGTRIKAEAKA